MVIADGMGGHRHGEIAAQLAVKMLTEAFQAQAKPRISNPEKFFSTEILKIHRAIEAQAFESDLLESPRTTIVAGILQGHSLYSAHVGDSRLYHIRDGNILFKTEDHSLVQKLYRKGHLRRTEMFTHPERHKIYNCLGGERDPQIDISHFKNLMEGDLILLCSDGLWSQIDDDLMCKTLQQGSVRESIPQLLEMSEEAAGEIGDNMSAIGLQWGDINHNALAVSTVTMPMDFATTILNELERSTIPNGKTDPANDLTDEAIEKAIAEIQAVLKKSNRD